MQKGEQKVKLRNGLSLYFWFHISSFFKETLGLWFLSFCFKVFFFSLNWIFSLNSVIMESNTSLLNVCLFSAPLYIVSINCSLDQLESHKRDLFHEKSTFEMSALSLFPSVWFDLIFSSTFIYFQILFQIIGVLCKKWNNN